MMANIPFPKIKKEATVWKPRASKQISFQYLMNGTLLLKAKSTTISNGGQNFTYCS